MPAACYGHADVGCLHIRPIINVKTAGGVETLRQSPREVSDLVVEFGGAMSGEHGDGLARSLWNRKLFGPEVYSAFQAIKRGFDPQNLLNPGKVVGDADPGDNLRIGPDYHPHEPRDDDARLFGAGGVCRRGRDVLGRRRLPQEFRSGTMCPSYMVTHDEMHTTRGRANLLRLVMTGELPSGDQAFDNDVLHEALDLCLAMQGLQERMPVEGRHGQAQGRSALSALPEPAPSARASAAGPHLSAEPDRVRDGPAGQPHAAQSGRSNGCSRKPPASTAGAPCPLSPAITFAAGFAGTSLAEAPERRGEVVLLDDCFTTYNEPEVGIATVKVLEAAGYRVRLAGLECCGRPAISEGSAAAGSRACSGERRETASVRSSRNPDPWLRAELPGDAGRRISRLPPGAGCGRGCQGLDHGRRLCRRHRAGSGASPCSPPRPRALARPLSAEGRARHVGNTGRAAAIDRPRDQGDRLGLLRHGRLVRLRAAGTSTSASRWQTACLIPAAQADPGGGSGGAGILVPFSASRPRRARSLCTRCSFWQNALHEPIGSFSLDPHFLKLAYRKAMLRHVSVIVVAIRR